MSASVKRIFVVDDDADVAEVAAQALAGRDRAVRAFNDPIRALAALTAEDVDLLVTDLQMPWIDGKDAIESARLRRPRIAAVLMSGTHDDARVVADRLGVRLVRKPFDLDELRAAVDAALAEQP